MSKTKKSVLEAVTVTGTPTALLLPARNYRFKVFTKEYSITLPRSGKFSDLDNKNFSKDDGEFDFLQYNEEDGSHVIFFPILSRVLFGTNQYPDLKDGQAFAPLAIVVKDDSVELLGNLIEMVMVKED